MREIQLLNLYTVSLSVTLKVPGNLTLHSVHAFIVLSLWIGTITFGGRKQPYSVVSRLIVEVTGSHTFRHTTLDSITLE